MKFVNCTPHTINVHRADGTVLEIPASGQVVRVAQKNVVVNCARFLDGIEIYSAEFGAVEGLPEATPDTMFIVSGMVRAALGNGVRPDVVAVGAPVRDADGKVIGCKGFIR